MTTLIRRFTKSDLCPICRGHDAMPRAQGIRCHGFLSSDGQYAHCTRDEHAGGLEVNPNSDTYAHRIVGDCRCGIRHDPQPQTFADIVGGSQNTRQKILVKTYPYHDENGDLRYEALRYRYDDNGEKTFQLRRPDGNGGWIYNAKGVDRLPYHLPELLAAPRNATTFIPEGEDDVDRLRSLGLVATTNSEGAGNLRLEVIDMMRLQSQQVVLFEDNDEDGRRRVATAAPIIHEVAEWVKIVTFHDMLEHSDVSDWLDAGHTREELLDRVAAAPIWTPESFRTSESSMLGGSEESRAIHILPSQSIALPDADVAKGYLDPVVPPPPGLVLLSGESSAGKTVSGYNIAYCLAEGVEFCGLRPPRPLRVLYVDLESPEPVFRSQVDIIGRSDNLVFVRELPASLDRPNGKTEFLEACRPFRPDVVFIDPLSMAWPVDNEDDNARADFQMSTIKKMAVDFHWVIVCLWNMGEGNVKEKFKARGATARIDRSDLALNFVELTDTTRQLKVVKSRYGTRGLALTLRFAGDLGFEAVDTEDPTGPSAIITMEQRIKELIPTGQKTRKELVSVLGNEDLADKALHRLVLAGELRRVKRGLYEAIVSSEPPNIGDSDSEEVLGEDEGEV